MTARRAVPAAALAVLALLASGLVTRAGGVPPRDPASHAPVAVAGATRRPALDGARAGRAAGGPQRRGGLPYSPNASAVTGRAGERSYEGTTATYRTTVTVPAAGDYAIRFESVHHAARVYLDGRLVARHTGGYLPFEARARLRAGAHALVLRADWRSPERMKRSAWHRTWFNFGGINREVTIRRLGASEVDAPAITTRIAKDGAALVHVAARVRNRGAARTVRLEGTLGGSPLRFAPLHLDPGRAGWARAELRVERPALWAPGHAALYDLALDVPGESGWRGRVGLRELRWNGGRLRLNGRPLVLHGASLQEDAPGRGDALQPADMDAVVARLRAIGANATRSQHSLNPALLERLDV